MIQSASTVLLAAARLAHAPDAEIAAAVAAHVASSFVVVVGDACEQDMLRAVGRLAAALRATSADGLAVRMPSLATAPLAALRAAGATAVEWPVLAPTPDAAAELPGHAQEPEVLRAALDTAHGAGLQVRLNWYLSRQATPALASLDQWASQAPAAIELAIQPWLGEDASRVPLLHEVRKQWPAWFGRDSRVRLIRSELWPACLGVDGRAGAPAPQRELAHHRVGLQPACADCPHAAARRCPGIAHALVQALEAKGQSFAGWRDLDQPPMDPLPQALHFDATCVELRGLQLGLRAAWRLTLPPGELAQLQATVAPLGLSVVGWPQRVRAHAGAAFAPVPADDPQAVALVVVARDPAVAQACLQDEMSLTIYEKDDRPGAGKDEEDAHWRLGAAYGYPACCVAAFCVAHGESFPRVWDADDAHWVARAHAASTRFDARLSTFAGPTGERNHSPLRHFPCRFDCPASIALADALLADLRVSNPAWFARHAADRPAAVVAFADGSYLLVDGQCDSPSGPITHIRAISGCFLGSDTAAARLRPQLGCAGGVQALAVRPGRGIALQNGQGWHEVDLAGPAGLERAAVFPLILPFA